MRKLRHVEIERLADGSLTLRIPLTDQEARLAANAESLKREGFEVPNEFYKWLCEKTQVYTNEIPELERKLRSASFNVMEVRGQRWLVVYLGR